MYALRYKFQCAEALVVLPALQVIELRDVVAREDLLRRADAVDAVARDADDCVRNAPRQIELVEREQHGEVDNG